MYRSRAGACDRLQRWSLATRLPASTGFALRKVRNRSLRTGQIATSPIASLSAKAFDVAWKLIRRAILANSLNSTSAGTCCFQAPMRQMRIPWKQWLSEECRPIAGPAANKSQLGRLVRLCPVPYISDERTFSARNWRHFSLTLCGKAVIGIAGDTGNERRPTLDHHPSARTPS